MKNTKPQDDIALVCPDSNNKPKAYTSPTLIDHGSVADMIKGNAGGTVDAFAGGTTGT